MYKLKKVLTFLFLFIGVIVLTSFLFFNLLKPTYNGEQDLVGLSNEVKVYYDSYGIPHIYGETEEDALRALGYVHAQDRLWQMELLRRIARGGLSEVFGEKTVSTDKFFLSMGIDEYSEQTVANQDENSPVIKLSNAYLDGINQFIDEGPKPIEYYLTGLEMEYFTIKDVYNTMGYMAFSFAQAHKTDPLLTTIKANLGADYLVDLEIDVNPNSTLIKNYNIKSDTLMNKLTAMTSEALLHLPIPQFEGSNSWVIGADKTKNGKVIFANDPHIGFAQPSVWYEAHVKTPNYEKYGYHMAGFPFPILGHDRKIAYGMTMFENDDVDFYYEKTHPTDTTKYKTVDGWDTYQIVNKTIKVKDEDPISFSYKKTKHGPVLNGIVNQISGDRPISMSWIYTKLENKVVNTIYGMSHANNLTEFKEALPKLHAPGLNIMYGDADNNVGWFASAKLYQMPDSVHTKLILDGTLDNQEPIRYLDFSENPQAINPPWNYVYSANNQPDSINGSLYPGYYLPENRARRIVQLLEPKNDWDKEDVQKMITDVTSPFDPNIAANLAHNLKIKELRNEQILLIDKLRIWNGEYATNSYEATVYTRWIYYFLENTFKDELGDELFTQFLSTHFHKRLIGPMSLKPNSVWWDNVSTKDTVESKQDIVHASFVQAMESLRADFGNKITDWSWDKVHTLEHEHPIGQVAALRSFFNVGPFPINGTREVINNMLFTYDGSGKYKVKTGPSTRRVIDFSDIENSMSILPTGQSGNPFSPHYKDQAEMYVNGEFRKMMMNDEEIIKNSKDVLIFSPSEK